MCVTDWVGMTAGKKERTGLKRRRGNGRRNPKLEHLAEELIKR